jgi:hypothetical protein
MEFSGFVQPVAWHPAAVMGTAPDHGSDQRRRPSRGSARLQPIAKELDTRHRDIEYSRRAIAGLAAS